MRNSYKISSIINQVGWSLHQWCMNRTRSILIELVQHSIHTLICNKEKNISIVLVSTLQWQVRNRQTHWTPRSCSLVVCHAEWATRICLSLSPHPPLQCRVAPSHPRVSQKLSDPLRCFSLSLWCRRQWEEHQASKIFSLSRAWSWPNLIHNNLSRWWSRTAVRASLPPQRTISFSLRTILLPIIRNC